MLRGLALLILSWGLVPDANWAQALPEVSPEVSATQSDAASDAATTRALIEALEDEATRDRLILALEGALETPDANVSSSQESTGRAHLDTESDELDPSIGGRVLATVPEIASGFIEGVQNDWNRLRATTRRLGSLGRLEAPPVRDMLTSTGMLLAISFGTALLGHLLFKPVSRAIGRAGAGARTNRKLLLAGMSILLDLAVLMVATLCTAAVMRATGLTAPEAGYLNYYVVAFFVGGLLIIATRAFFSPTIPELRPVTISDAAAVAASWHLGVMIMFAMMGELYVNEAIKYLAGPITASAAVVAVHILIVLYITVLVIRYRKAPVRWLNQLAAETPDSVMLPILAAAARYWHLPALVLLLIIFHQVVTGGSATFPVLFQLPSILLTLAATVYVISRLNLAAERGLGLSESLESAMPNLRGQLDAFVPPFFRLLSWIVFFVWVAFTFHTLEIARPWSWIEARFGFDFASVIASLVIILLVSYAAWLAVTTWIDHRLKPIAGQAPSARQQTLYSLLRNVLLVVILLTALAYALSSFGVSVAPLLASAGVVGLAISWGSQKLVQDVITGLFIQVENVFNVGDVIELGGRIGTVEKLTIRSVSLRDVQGVMHTIPFSSVDAVSNHMRGYSYHVADISVAYGADLDRAKDEMLAAYDDLAADFEWGTRLLGGVEWFGVETLGPNAVTLRARLKTRPGEQWAVGRAYAERVKRRFDAAGIEIPFPQLRLWTEGDRRPDAAPAAITPAPRRSADSPTDADFDGGADGEGSDR